MNVKISQRRDHVDFYDEDEDKHQVRTSSQSEIARLVEFRKRIERGEVHTTAPLLRLLLNLDNRPFSLDEHYQFEPVFRTRRPKKMLLLAARQCGKTTAETADGVVKASCIPNFKILYVTPLFEQVRRISSNYVRKFVNQSPVKKLITGGLIENSVLQKTFANGSTMQFSFAGQDCDRIRGLSEDEIRMDEVQDMDGDHIPIINETMSHSRWGFSLFAGTPKTPDNIIHGLWSNSSQAEWLIPCRACGKENICSSKYDLEKIIGPWRKDISAEKPATICANPKCRKIIYPWEGFWIHKHKQKRWKFTGLHIPQPIMHIHYSDRDKWAELLAKRQGYGSYTPNKYFNEVLGESCGTGMQLVSEEELRKAADLPWTNKPYDPGHQAAQCGKYQTRVLAVDWGGGGEDQISLTTLAVLGVLPGGVIHVIWGKRLMTPHDHLAEAKEVLYRYKQFGCQFIVHDYTGAGTLRETFLHHKKIPLDRIVPVSYVRAAASNIITFKPATDIHPRNYYSVDKTRSLLNTCQMIKMRKLRFFQFDFVSTDDPGLIYDFLGLVENKVPTKRGSDIYTIQRHALRPDDFAQAVNIGCCTIWHMFGEYPNLAAEQESKLITEQELKRAELDPEDPDWGFDETEDIDQRPL